MLKSFALLGSLLLSFALYATESLELVDLNNPEAWSSENVSTLMEMVTDAPSGDGRSSSAPITVYVPLESGAINQYSTVPYPSDLITSTWAGYLRTRFYASNTTGNTLYLYAAILDTGSSYKVISSSLATIPDQTSKADLYPLVYMYELCNLSLSSGTSFCTAAVNSSFEKKIVFFLSTDAGLIHDSSTTVTESTSTLFYNFKFSTTVNNTTAPVISEIRKGDERLKLVYTAPSMNSYYKTIVLGFSGAQVAAQNYYAATATNHGALLASEEEQSYATSGYFTLKHLQNNQSYEVGLAFVDKFQFATLVSATKSGTPEQIDTFIKKQSCYLISAGFQEEHYVIEYFKAFRDGVLLKNVLGRKFVSFYYSTAPQYAPYIYKNATLSAFVRGLSYCLYFLFHFFPYILGFFVLGIIASFFALKNRRFL